MTDSIRASQQGLKLVEWARLKKRWTKLAIIWCDCACVSQATLRRFWASQAIRSENFFSICDAVGVDWEEVIDRSSVFEEPDSSKSTQEQLFLPDAIAEDEVNNGKIAITKCLTKGEIAQQQLDETVNKYVLSNQVDREINFKQLVVQDNRHLVALLCNKTTPEAKTTPRESMPPIQDILVEIIQFLSHNQKRYLPTFLKRKILPLIDCLHTSCCLLILENASEPEVTKDIINRLFGHQG